jgi:hypothetical protein
MASRDSFFEYLRADTEYWEDWPLEELKMRVAYHRSTEFLVQVGKGKGSYRTANRFVGDLDAAIKCFDAVDISAGYKKRLLMPACSKNPVLAIVRG